MAEKVGEASVVLSAVDKATEVINKVTGQFDALGSKWGKLVGALGVGAGFTGLTALVTQSINAADRMEELAAATGTSAKFLESMQLVVKTSGADMEAFARSMLKLGVAMETAVDDPTSKAAVSFRNLGVEIVDTSGKMKTQEQIVLDLADAFVEADDKQRIATIGAEMLGKQWLVLAPIIAGGSENIRESMQLAEDLGLVLDDQARSGMAAFADTVEVMKMSSQGFGNTIAQQLTPALSGLAQLWLDNAKNSGGFRDVLATSVTYAFKGLISTAMAAWDVLKAVGTVLAGVFASAATMSVEPFTQSLADANQVMKDGKQRIADLWADALPQLSQAALAAGHANRTLGEETTKGAKAAESQAEAQRKLRAELLGDVAALEMNERGVTKLSEAQKLMLKVGEAIAAGKLKLSQLDTVEIFNRLKMVDAAQREAAALKSLSDSYAATMQEQDKAADAVSEQVKAQIRYNETLGLSKTALVAYEIAEKQVRITQLERIQATEGLTTAQAQELSQLRLLIELMKKGEIKAAAIDDAKATRDAWTDVASDIESALTDAMVQGFEGGKSIAKSVGDWIANYFKSVVARTIAQSLMAAMAAGLGSAAQAMGGGAGGGSGMSSIGSVLSMGSSMFGAGGGGGGGMGSILGLMGGTGAAGFGTGVYSGMLGAFSGAMGEGAALSAAGFGAEGAGMMLGSAIPYLAIAYGLYRIISGVGTGRMRGPAYQEWATSGPASNIFAGGINNPGGGTWAGGHYQAQVDAIAKTVETAARLLGGVANRGTTYGLYSAQSPDGRGANTVSQVVGANSAGYYIARTGGNADVAQLFADTIPAMILAGLRDSDLPKQIKDYIERTNIGSQADLDRVIQTAAAAQQMADAFDELGGPFADLADISVEARMAIADLTGGLEAFTQKVQGYYAAFYSQEEQQALSLVQAQKILQEAGIDTGALVDKGSFRRTLEGIDATTPEGQEMFAAMINAAQSFAAGADLLTLSGMSLRDFTAGAPGLEDGVVAIASAQEQTNTLLQNLGNAVVASGQAVVAAIQDQRITVEVRSNGQEVGFIGSTVGGGN